MSIDTVNARFNLANVRLTSNAQSFNQFEINKSTFGIARADDEEKMVNGVGKKSGCVLCGEGFGMLHVVSARAVPK